MSNVLWVTHFGHEWHLKVEGGNVVSKHPTKEAGINAARKLIDDSPHGSIRQIKIQHADRSIGEEWTYGQDT
jgi:hypothetical protein